MSGFVDLEGAVAVITGATNILEQITFYGEPSSPRSPDYPMVDADEAGEMPVAAVESGRFLAFTTPTVHDELRGRGADIDTYLTHCQEGSI